MTTTDIGILLIVLCVLLWAIMAALHRHTVQMEALKTQLAALKVQLDALLNAQQSGSSAPPGKDAQARGDLEHRDMRAPNEKRA